MEEETFEDKVKKLVEQIAAQQKVRTGRWLSEIEVMRRFWISKTELQKMRDTGKIHYTHNYAGEIVYDADSLK